MAFTDEHNKRDRPPHGYPWTEPLGQWFQGGKALVHQRSLKQKRPPLWFPQASLRTTTDGGTCK